MIYRFTDFFMIILTVWIGLIPLFGVPYVYEGIEINLEDSYLEEYVECQTELEKTIPNCPDCVCKTSSGFFASLVGFVWGLIIMFIIMENKEKISKWFIKRKVKRSKG